MGYEVVTELVSWLYGKYHHVVRDNFFGSPVLCEDLFNNKTYFTSTVRNFRKGMPKSLKTAKVANGDMIVKQSGPVMVMKYGGRKNVTLLSSFGTPVIENRENSRGIERQITNVNNMYNKYMGGVDLGDAKIQTYDSEMRSVKMWKKLLINILLRIVVNGYIIYKQNRGLRTKMSRLDFITQLCQELVGEYRTERLRPGRNTTELNRLTERHFPDYIPDGLRRRCRVCKKRTRFMCDQCRSGLCIGQCFKTYHTIRCFEE